MDNILSINLETTSSPIIKEVKGREYIEYGTEEYRNLYPQFLIDLYRNSSTHAAIISQTRKIEPILQKFITYLLKDLELVSLTN